MLNFLLQHLCFLIGAIRIHNHDNDYDILFLSKDHSMATVK